jgi:hypothetical protein
MDRDSKSEVLPSGKRVTRCFGPDGSLVEEQHFHGLLDIGIKYEFNGEAKVSEIYFSKRRLVSRTAYEKARAAYPDMPPAGQTAEDWGGSLLRDVRQQQRRNKAEAEQRLAQSEESRFPRPASTSWLRVISEGSAHLVVFASRDWKVLSNERTIPTGREWLRLFGFMAPVPSNAGAVAGGWAVGYEVPGDRVPMLNASIVLLREVNAYALNPPEISRWSGSIRPRPKPRKPPPLAWPTALPPLIEFLSILREPTVKIFNHHR